MNRIPRRLKGTVPHSPGWGKTRVTPVTGWFLVLGFLFSLLLVPLLDATSGGWKRAAENWSKEAPGLSLLNQTSFFPRMLEWNARLQAWCEIWETEIGEQSWFSHSIRPSWLDFLLTYGRAGSEECYVGRAGSLHYRKDVDALIQGQIHSEAAEQVASFAADLAERNIRLLLLVIPGKATIHPEWLGASESSLLPQGFESLEKSIQENWLLLASDRGLDPEMAPILLDVTSALLLEKERTGRPQFLQTDSHWTPEAMQQTARLTTEAIQNLSLTGAATESLHRTSATLAGVGDIASMLNLPESSIHLRKEEVSIHPVGSGPEPNWAPSPSSPVLLLGDSYTNIYSDPSLGWGGSAGLAEQISHLLGSRIDRISRNDAGATEGRNLLIREATRSPEWLDTKALVVWQLPMRELVFGDWKSTPFPPSSPPSDTSRSFLHLKAGEERSGEAKILSLAGLPTAGATPYADFLTAACLEFSDGGQPRRAVVYFVTMRNHQRTGAAGLREGETIRVRLKSWEDYEPLMGTWNRAELDDLDLMLEPPNFAEWISDSDT